MSKRHYIAEWSQVIGRALKSKTDLRHQSERKFI